jgi:hypothetical protein
MNHIDLRPVTLWAFVAIQNLIHIQEAR